MSPFPVDHVRAAFPALQDGFIFFDNAAGAQSPQAVLDAVADHLLHRNVQRGGRYRQSQEVDAAIARARESVALLVNARHPDEISFGMNATSFMRLISIAIGQSLGERREIIITDLDHEANIAVWLALEREGAKIVWWHFREDGRLHPEDLEPLLSPRTRIVACTLASNAIGSVLDVAGVSRRARAMLDALSGGKATVYGITARDQVSLRTPTLCFNLPGIAPARVTEALAQQNIGVRDGHMYSPRLMKRLGLARESGAVRASLAHYNTREEVEKFQAALAAIAQG